MGTQIEPPHVLLAANTANDYLDKLNNTQTTLLMAMGRYLNDSNEILLSRLRRQALVKEAGISKGTFRNALTALTQNGALERLSPQDFKVNPEVYIHPGFLRKQRKQNLGDIPTALYRHYSDDDELLYVGISKSAPTRLAQHMYGSPWARDICRVDIETLPNRDQALRAERKAIINERPLWNTAHNRQRLTRSDDQPGQVPVVEIRDGKATVTHYLPFKGPPFNAPIRTIED